VQSVFFFSSRRRHTRFSRDWSSDVCSSDLDLVARARMKRLKPQEYSNPTFSISNMGMLGVTHFDALPSPGTSAIFAIATRGPNRSEERRVGKEWKSRWAAHGSKKNMVEGTE